MFKYFVHHPHIASLYIVQPADFIDECKPLMAQDDGIDALFTLASTQDVVIKGYASAILAALSQIGMHKLFNGSLIE